MIDPPTLLRVLPPLEQSPEALAELATACEERTAAPGTLLMREGEAADTLVGVLAGEVDVLRRVGEQQRTMVRLGPGTLLGETALVAELRRTASVRAHDEVRFVSLPAAAARQAMTRSPPLVLWLIERQMRRLQEREDSYLEALRQGIVARDKELAELRLTRPAAAADDEGVWSPSLAPVLDRARRLARSDLPVLIGGEPGTGKELLARYVHQHSERRGRQLCSLNCAAIPAEIAEAELFGARKGAFTGAERDRHGLFHEADGGTLFLDEIGDLPLPVQAKLLRALQDGTYYALGSRQPQRADVRVVSATNKDLRKEATEGRFREDLMYRIEGARLHLPPLRERPDHIPLLVRWVVGRAIPDAEPAHVTRDVMPALLRYRWPGNVRELIHVLKAAIALTVTYPRLQPADLPEEVRRAAAAAPGDPAARAARTAREATTDEPAGTADPVALEQRLAGRSLPDYLRDVTRALILDALAACGGVRKDAAAALGITPQNLSNYIKRLDLPRRSTRRPGSGSGSA